MTTVHTIKSSFILCPFFALVSSAQNFPDLRFTHLTTKDGLSSNTVGCIFKDSRGFMWIGTDNGLNCYDGRRFKVYQHNSADSNSLPDNNIRYIIAGRENNFWISTRLGLASFDPFTGKCKNYFHHEGDANSLSNNFRPIPFIDSRGKLWLATIDGVQLFDPGKNSFTTFRLPVPENPQQKKDYNNNFQTILEDGQHRIWVTSANGLHEINQQDFSFTSYYTGKAGLSFLCDHRQQLWVGQFSGDLMQYNPAEKKLSPHTFSNRTVYALQEWNSKDQNNWICMGTEAGLFLYDPFTRLYKQYLPDNNNEYSLMGNVINCFYKDEMNRLWIGTNKGMNILDPNLQHFQNYWLSKSSDKSSIGESRLARCLYEDDATYMLGVWYRKGLYNFDKSWNFLHQVFPATRKNAGGYIRSIYDIYKDPEGNEWYSTDSGIIKKSSNKFAIYVPPDGESVERGDFELREILPRNDGLFWIRAKRSGVYLFDKTKGVFLHHYRYEKGKKNCLPDCIMNAIRYDNRSRLWVCTEKGLYRYNESTDDFTFFYFNYMNKQDEILLNRIKDVACDEKNLLWIATEKGLVKLNTETGKYEVMDKSRGLIEENIGRILFDKKGIVWITTNKGLISYDDSKKTFRLFNASFGVPVENYNADAVFVFNRKGNIVMGGDNFVTEFDPYTLPSITEPPPVEIAGVQVMNKPVVYSNIGPHQKLLSLPAGTNQLSVQFSVLNYTSPLQNKFYYKLKGVNDNWIQSDDGSINFTNLQAGHYDLLVKGANNDGVMNETGDRLAIIIAPYFWQTWWFRLSAVLLAVALTYWLIRRRIKFIRHEAGMKQKIAETEMMALRAQMNPHFIFNCLNSIDNLIQSNEKEKATIYLAKFAKLIRAILENSKNNAIACWKDIETMQLYLELEELRCDKKFSYKVSIDADILHGDYKVPPLVVQPFVENAIHHGLMNKKESDKQLHISVFAENNEIRYTIEDNGVGRKQAAEYKKLNRSFHNSMGMDITAERINLFNGKNGSVKITDLYDEQQQPAGTKVEIQLINQN